MRREKFSGGGRKASTAGFCCEPHAGAWRGRPTGRFGPAPALSQPAQTFFRFKISAVFAEKRSAAQTQGQRVKFPCKSRRMRAKLILQRAGKTPLRAIGRRERSYTDVLQQRESAGSAAEAAAEPEEQAAAEAAEPEQQPVPVLTGNAK